MKRAALALLAVVLLGCGAFETNGQKAEKCWNKGGEWLEVDRNWVDARFRNVGTIEDPFYIMDERGHYDYEYGCRMPRP